MISGKVVLGVFAGAVAGAVLGVLFSPAKGSVTRRRIARRCTEYAEDTKEKLNDYVDGISEKYDSIKDDAKGLVHKGK